MTNKKPSDAGIYVHIPFCARKCRYCDFLSGPAGPAKQRRYFEALKNEIRYAGLREGKELRIKTVFFGGGTPSFAETEEIECVMQELKNAFQIDGGAEITMECNPGTVTEEKLRRYRMAGVNRLSFGVQSMQERELQLLGRIHTRETVLENVQAAREAGFSNINVDLMSALPDQTVAIWEDTLAQILRLSPEHISAYSLMIEEGTPFFAEYGEGRNAKRLPDEKTERRMYHRTARILREAGYRHYEISNYARPGYQCRHNLTYWRQGEYLGFGLGAASFFGGIRWKNTSDMEAYCRTDFHVPKEEILWRREEIRLTRENRMEEFMFLGLRCMNGVSKAEFERRFSCSMAEVYGGVIEQLRQLGLLKEKGNRVFLTAKGVDVSNAVLARFLL